MLFVLENDYYMTSSSFNPEALCTFYFSEDGWMDVDWFRITK